MNISRVALLTVLFSAPMFAMDTTTAVSTGTAPVAATTSCFTKLGGLVTAPFSFALVTAPDVIAGYTVKPVLDYVASMRYLNFACFSGNTQQISRAVVLAAAAYAGYLAYNKYIAEQTAEANEDFFSDDAN